MADLLDLGSDLPLPAHSSAPVRPSANFQLLNCLLVQAQPKFERLVPVEVGGLVDSTEVERGQSIGFLRLYKLR